jgi:hypothetical protein
LNENFVLSVFLETEKEPKLYAVNRKMCVFSQRIPGIFFFWTFINVQFQNLLPFLGEKVKKGVLKKWHILSRICLFGLFFEGFYTLEYLQGQPSPINELKSKPPTEVCPIYTLEYLKWDALWASH